MNERIIFRKNNAVNFLLISIVPKHTLILIKKVLFIDCS